MKARALWNGQIIAESEHCLFVGGNYYFPPEAVERRYLVISEYRSLCPWKGEADYFHVQVDGRKSSNAAFLYPRPNPDYAHLAGYIAFWKDVEIENKSTSVRPGGSPEIASDELLSALIKIPKTEIHLHLESLADAHSIYKLMLKSNEDIPGVKSEDDLIKKFQVTNLEDFIDLFINVIQPVFTREDDFYVLTGNLRNYMLRNNIFYTEVFFAPTKFLLDGLDFGNLVDILEGEAARFRQEDNLTIRYLVDVSRSYGPENAMKNLDLVLAHPRSSIIGIGLGGSETRGPAADYGDVFARARAEGLRTVAHAGEDVGPESVWDTVNILGAARIGHGISAMLDENLMRYLAEHEIPIECCPTSNVFTQKYVHNLSEHPIRHFFERGMVVTVNTDDPSIFGVELVDELMNVHNHCGFSFADLGRLILTGLDATFMSDAEKAAHRARVQRAIDEATAALQQQS